MAVILLTLSFVIREYSSFGSQPLSNKIITNNIVYEHMYALCPGVHVCMYTRSISMKTAILKLNFRRLALGYSPFTNCVSNVFNTYFIHHFLSKNGKKFLFKSFILTCCD